MIYRETFVDDGVINLSFDTFDNVDQITNDEIANISKKDPSNIATFFDKLFSNIGKIGIIIIIIVV
ncbi:MAG: hypothetical protein RR062_06250, partial [Clostridia bacterium]